MFSNISNINLSDRLKAAVKEFETQGAALQQRALGAQHQQQQQAGVPQASSSSTLAAAPASPVSPTLSNGATAPINVGNSRNRDESSPNRGAYISPTNIADSALSGLSGLRKSFNFAPRGSTDSGKSASGSHGRGSTEIATQELRDIASPTSSTANRTPNLDLDRPSSPGKFLSASGSTPFALGSDPSSVAATPIPRSPRLGGPGPSHLRSESTTMSATLPPPDPSDPASYPLPPSPPLTSLSVPSPRFHDPLGASPLITPAEPDAPELSLDEPTLAAAHADDGVPDAAQDAGLGVSINGDEATLADGPDAESMAPVLEDLKENGVPTELGLEAIQQLANVDQRYQDLSKRYEKVVKEMEAANSVFKDLTPLDGGVADAEALEGWVRMMKGKVDMITEEMKRLQAKITLQDSRMEELRDTHRLEGTSQTDLIAKLRGQLSTAETNLASKANELLVLGQLRSDLTKAQTTAKEEEEKRTKAISLLKTVRMKLVKLEKDKEEVERDRAEERAERSRAGEEVERVKAEREREVNALRKGFEREMTAAKERFDKELRERKGAWELEMITTKASHAKELSNKSTKVAGLEAVVRELQTSNSEQFEVLQSRVEEAESARAEAELLRNRTNELEFQLRESNARCAVLEEAANSSSGGTDRGRASLGVGKPDGVRASASPSPSRHSSFTNAGELQRILAEAENRSEAKLSDLRHKIRSLEKERNEAEEEWAAKLQERASEAEKLRRMITEKESEYSDSLRRQAENDAKFAAQEEARRGLERDIKGLKARLEESKEDIAGAEDAERLAKDELSALRLQVSNLTLSLEDSRSQYNTLKANSKTLREEMRKLQSSVQLLEKSRNPGVGYWSQGGAGHNAAASGSNMSSAARSGEGTPTGSEIRKSLESVATTGRESVVSDKTVDKANEEEEVNLEYLRNVILQFLEHKEMRPNLVRVLSVILRFTPQELRRLNAKLQS